MFLKSISFKKNIDFDVMRESQTKMFKVKSKECLVDDRTKPIGTTSRMRTAYEKKKIIEQTFIIFKKGLTIEFNSNITIIVGDNGCGKTTLINNLIYPKPRFSFGTKEEKAKEYQELIKEWLDNEERLIVFDKNPDYFIIEKDIHKSAHIRNATEDVQAKTFNGKLKVEEFVSLFDMQDFSNGENNLDFLNALKGITNALIVLDEPETSLSIKSQFKINSLIKELSETNQLIIITHSENLMRLADVVYDFEKKKYINTEKYIKQQKLN